MFCISVVTTTGNQSKKKTKTHHCKTVIFHSTSSWTSLKSRRGRLHEFPAKGIRSPHEVLTKMITSSCKPRWDLMKTTIILTGLLLVFNAEKVIKTDWSTSWKLQQVLRLWGSRCSLLKVSENPEGVSELSFAPSGTYVSCDVRTGVLVFLSADKAFASFFPASGPHQSRAPLIPGEPLTQWQAGDLADTAASVLQQVLFVSSSYRRGHWHFSFARKWHWWHRSNPYHAPKAHVKKFLTCLCDETDRWKAKTHLVLFVAELRVKTQVQCNPANSDL